MTHPRRNDALSPFWVLRSNLTHYQFSLSFSKGYWKVTLHALTHSLTKHLTTTARTQLDSRWTFCHFDRFCLVIFKCVLSFRLSTLIPMIFNAFPFEMNIRPNMLKSRSKKSYSLANASMSRVYITLNISSFYSHLYILFVSLSFLLRLFQLNQSCLRSYINVIFFSSLFYRRRNSCDKKGLLRLGRELYSN